MSAQLILTRTKAPTAGARGARRGPIRGAWRRIAMTISEMNYGARRFVEVQAPWAIDPQWHTR